ncbi:MAG: hypothetical protein AYK18_13905 [Theionarchaea archaeon DG-70]|nr:MAG: hypothetical protein AYK18_13905 [Theionarchaea archaeon DG-70]
MKAILRQHWEHARHCEIQILWFTSIYAAVVAGILAFIAETYKNNPPDLGSTPLLAFFGFILSVIGFLITVALTFGHHNHKMNVKIILYCWDKMELYVDPKKPVPYKRVHRWFFEFTVALFAVLSLLFYASKDWNSLAAFCEHRGWLIVALIGIFFFIEILYGVTWRKHSREQKRFIKLLQNDIEGYYRKNWKVLFRGPESWREVLKAEEERRKEKKTN